METRKPEKKCRAMNQESRKKRSLCCSASWLNSPLFPAFLIHRLRPSPCWFLVFKFLLPGFLIHLLHEQKSLLNAASRAFARHNQRSRRSDSYLRSRKSHAVMRATCEPGKLVSVRSTANLPAVFPTRRTQGFSRRPDSRPEQEEVNCQELTRERGRKWEPVARLPYAWGR